MDGLVSARCFTASAIWTPPRMPWLGPVAAAGGRGALRRLASILEQGERLEEALALHGEIARRSPQDLGAMQAQARLLLRLDRPDETELICRRGLDKDPAHLPLAVLRVRALIRQQETSAALAECLRLLNLHGPCAEVYAEIFLVARNTRDEALYDTLLRDLALMHRTGRIGPDLYAQALAEAGRMGEALVVLREAGPNLRDADAAVALRARCLAAKGWLRELADLAAPTHDPRSPATQAGVGRPGLPALLPVTRHRAGRGTERCDAGALCDPRAPAGAPPPPLEGVPRAVLFLAEHLGLGGFARWTVNTLRGLRERFGADVPIAGFWQRIDALPGYDFMVPEVRAAGVRILERQELAEVVLPEEYARACCLTGCRRAEEALPDGCDRGAGQGDLVTRPAIVDLHAERHLDIRGAIAALACGVRRIVVCHANPASPWLLKVQPDSDDLRDGLEHERALYRRLLRFPQLVLTNNSRAGVEDLGRWLDEPASRFGLLRNGTDTRGLDDWSAAGVGRGAA